MTSTKRVYTEVETAAILGTTRVTLWRWRKAGKMRDDIIVSKSAQDLGIPVAAIVAYDADTVDAIAKGEQRLDRKPEPVAP